VLLAERLVFLGVERLTLQVDVTHLQPQQQQQPLEQQQQPLEQWISNHCTRTTGG
jgi:hypothetical protein